MPDCISSRAFLHFILSFFRKLLNGSSNVIYGILAPVDRLWENFVGSEIIKGVDLKFEHHNETRPLLIRSKNKTLVKRREFNFHLPDIINIDAKYKPNWESIAIEAWNGRSGGWSKLDNNIYQILAYMYISNIRPGGSIFPSACKKDLEDFGIDEFEIISNNLVDSKFCTIPLIIPNGKTKFKK